MTISTPKPFITPICHTHLDYFDVRAGKNCIGMKKFEYSLIRPFTEDTIEKLNMSSIAQYPFGKEGRIVKIDVKRKWLLEAILNLNRCRITLLIGANAEALREQFESSLAQAMKQSQ